MYRVRTLKFVCWLIAGLAFAVAAGRFLYGLGATTNLTDGTPWGLWIGFDVLGGVALAAGGFTVTAIVYIFKLEKYHGIVRPAVLTAFLGYLAVAMGLFFDLGLPWNMWHMIIYWNPHSPLFEVGWCVMLYLTVLAMEFLPVPAEEFSALAKIRRFLIKIRLPLVLTGIGLSTLHQSSLGSLFLLMPHHLHPLWYSPILPVNFLLSAVGLGLLMVIFESHTTAYFYHREPETPLLSGLAGGVRWVLLVYLGVRFTDLAVRGQLPLLTAPGWQTWAFWAEVTIMAIAPALLFFVPAIRNTRTGQWIVATVGVLGVVVNRVNIGGLAHIGRGDYLPAWTELAISAGLVSVAVLVFLFMVEHFRVWEHRPADTVTAPASLPENQSPPAENAPRRRFAGYEAYSFAFILAAAIGFSVIAPEPAASRGVTPVVAHHARGGDELRIDGNLDGFGATFNHTAHKMMLGEEDSCAMCHHMNLPRDQNTGCHQCHRNMYLSSDAFQHDWHASPDEAAVACFECHPSGQHRRADTAKPCAACHHDLVPEGALITVKQYHAIGYVNAMHQLCIGCHATLSEDLTRCTACHNEIVDYLDAPDLPFRRRGRIGKRLVLPPY